METEGRTLSCGGRGREGERGRESGKEKEKEGERKVSWPSFKYIVTFFGKLILTHAITCTCTLARMYM